MSKEYKQDFQVFSFEMEDYEVNLSWSGNEKFRLNMPSLKMRTRAIAALESVIMEYEKSRHHWEKKEEYDA